MSQGLNSVCHMHIEFDPRQDAAHGDHAVPEAEVAPEVAPLRFGCEDCALRHSAHCDDCLVTHLCREDDGTVVVSMDDLRLVRRLQSGGLAPPLRHRKQVG